MDAIQDPKSLDNSNEFENFNEAFDINLKISDSILSNLNFDSPDLASNITFTNSGTIKTASFSKIIEKLTHPTFHGKIC